jgi:hypothetical protein
VLIVMVSRRNTVKKLTVEMINGSSMKKREVREGAERERKYREKARVYMCRRRSKCSVPVQLSV